MIQNSIRDQTWSPYLEVTIPTSNYLKGHVNSSSLLRSTAAQSQRWHLLKGQMICTFELFCLIFLCYKYSSCFFYSVLLSMFYINGIFIYCYPICPCFVSCHLDMVITCLAYWSDPLLRYHTLKFTTKRHGHLVFSSLSLKGEGFKTHKLGWTVANGKESVSSYLEPILRWTGASDFGTPLGGSVVDVFWCFVFFHSGTLKQVVSSFVFGGGDMSPSSRLESFTRSWLGVVFFVGPDV